MRRFPPPWTVEAIDAGFKIVDSTGQSLAYVYGNADSHAAGIANALTLARNPRGNVFNQRRIRLVDKALAPISTCSQEKGEFRNDLRKLTRNPTCGNSRRRHRRLGAWSVFPTQFVPRNRRRSLRHDHSGTRAQHDLASHGRRPGHFKYPNSRYFIFRDCVPCWQRGSGRGRPREPTQLTSLDRHSRWPFLKHSDGVANDCLLHEP